ncbi:hypothetical protein PVAND_002321 [Polypedilum vanderplanki]|uniref:Uncharacterized protein n=1 Tax=Polypedilum vanderplanki TaxID=319348 RepID=A0A9J6BQZ2_POLVA|nr:hypothetical protein PVAND_002321 [Polypedilum vanderplanki]
MASKAKLFIFINILSVIKVSLLETVHFTNSPNKILKATNYTTYKVEVPNGEPITIIEANQPLIDGKIKFDDAESAEKYSSHRNGDRRKHVMDLESTLSMTVTPNHNYEYENSAAAASTADEESVTNNDYSNLSHEHNQKRNTMTKTVYSPELLQKFLKDYASKIQNAGTASIEMISSQQQQQNHSGSSEIEQGNEDERDKYASVETNDDTANEEEDGNRRVSNGNVDDEKDSSELNDIQQRKNYRPNGNYNSNHPYNKNNGWVSLDAVPWSKSKVSKWHSNVKRFGSQGNNYNYQNGNNYGPRPSSSPYRPSSGNNNYDYDYNSGNNDNDDYYNSRPSRPTFHNNQYYGPSYQQSSRPPPPPQDNFYQSSHHYSSSSHHSGNNGYDQNYNRPNNNRPEIITDNRPSNFPTHSEDHHNKPYGHKPNYHNENPYHGGNYHSYKESPPATYPHNGEGEWVLVSTTKGYQFPKRNGQRAMSFAAQNGFGSNNHDSIKHNDNKGIITAASQNVEVYHRPHQSGPTKMSQQQVKLTVLPLFVNNEQNGNNNNNQHHNDIDMSVYKPGNHQNQYYQQPPQPQQQVQQAYGGLIETVQSNQTVEESAANVNNEAQTSTLNKSKKKRKVMKKNYLMRKSSGGTADSTAMIAAVGASLLPASLGLLAPMVLG